MGFSDDLWDGFDKVSERATQGKKFATEFQSFAKKRIEIEREYAKKLQSLVKSTKLTDLGTLDSAWTSIKAETESIAGYHLTFADSLTSQVDEPLKQWLSETQKQRKLLSNSGKKLISEFSGAQSDVEKARGRFESCRRKQDATQSEANSDPSNPKLNKKLLADTKNSEKADEGYKKSVEKMKVMEGRFYDSELPQILRDYEAMEVARVKLLKTSMISFAEAQASIPPKAKNSAEVMKNKSESINVDGDLQQFISSTRTGASKPGRTQYQPYDSALGACKPPSGGGGGGGGFSAPTPVSNPPSSTISPPAAVTKAPTPFSAPPARVPPSGGFGGGGGGGGFTPSYGAPKGGGGGGGGGGGDSFKVKALYAYTGTEDTELSFEEGDVITVTFKDESGWWEGELNGRVGVFPSNHVEELSGGGGGGGGGHANSGAPKAAGGGGGAAYEEAFDKCRALYEYKAEDSDELTIKEGDILTIDDEDDEGWYYGTNEKGQYGKFPSNYVELITK